MKIVKKSEIVKSSISSYLNNCFAIKNKTAKFAIQY